MVRRRSAKPICAGSSPALASIPVVVLLHSTAHTSSDGIYRSNIATVFLFEKIHFQCRIYS